MPVIPVDTTLAVGDVLVHRFQVVREHRGARGREAWIVVGIGPDELELASPGFEWSRTVPTSTIAEGTVEPVTAGGVPVWGY